ncbi:MAG: phage portal protein [Acutalibacter sp.]
MSKKQKRAREPTQKRSVAFVTNSGWETLECAGYTSLAHNPEITTAVDTIARLIGSMTIHLMENTEHGDIRVRNELSRKVDIDPNQYMTRSAFVQWIVKTMMLDGNGNAVVYPETRRGILRDLRPVPAVFASFVQDGWGYKVIIDGRQYGPDDVLHFVLNPGSFYPWLGEGYRVALSDVANNLKQAAATEKGFMSSKWKPSIIVKVDSLTDEFSSPEGRRKLLEDYVETTEAGEPWMIPADQFSVEQVRPLTLSDLALADFVQLDKRTVAAILGVPPFVLGVGDFHREAWNNFISSTIMPIARMIEQELTRKLLVSPNWFFRFNVRSLYNYELRDMAQVADDQFVRGIMTGNEVRDWIGMPPLDGLNELVILENYIPRGMIGDQNKLNGGDSA